MLVVDLMFNCLLLFIFDILLFLSHVMASITFEGEEMLMELHRRKPMVGRNQFIKRLIFLVGFFLLIFM